MQVKELEVKQIYQRKIEAQLGQLDAQIIGLKAKVDQARTTAKTRHYDKVAGLSTRQQAAQLKLQVLKSASEDNWQACKVSMESALHELQEAFNNALAQFKQFSQTDSHLV